MKAIPSETRFSTLYKPKGKFFDLRPDIFMPIRRATDEIISVEEWIASARRDILARKKCHNKL